MDCIECKTTNPDDNRFCGKCGAELGRTLDQTLRKKGFTDRKATEMEITESVVDRLAKWGKLLAGIVALILAAFAFAFSLVYRDTRAALDAGKTQIESAVTDGKNKINASVTETTNEIGAVKRSADVLAK
jgi:uncharacterized membrane protein YvbJ